MKEIKITSNEEGQRLDIFLKKYLSKATHAFILKMIINNNMNIDNS